MKIVLKIGGVEHILSNISEIIEDNSMKLVFFNNEFKYIKIYQKIIFFINFSK